MYHHLFCCILTCPDMSKNMELPGTQYPANTNVVYNGAGDEIRPFPILSFSSRLGVEINIL